MTELTIHGARGTAPVCASTQLKYGGKTTCFSLRTNDACLVVDAGTGLLDFQPPSPSAGAPDTIHLFFTHFHMDHLFGLYPFKLRHDPAARLCLLSSSDPHGDWRATLERAIASPYWPSSLARTEAAISYRDLAREREGFAVGSTTVAWLRVSHPQGCLAYRFDTPDGRVVIATDVELDATDNDGLDRFCADCDALVMDAQFTPEEYASHRGWGHSSWRAAAQFAARVGARQLILTHHDPDRTDAEIDAIERQAGGIFPRAAAARAGMLVRVGGSSP